MEKLSEVALQASGVDHLGSWTQADEDELFEERLRREEKALKARPRKDFSTIAAQHEALRLRKQKKVGELEAFGNSRLSRRSLRSWTSTPWFGAFPRSHSLGLRCCGWCG